MFEFNPEGKKVILTIDGGGMRGTIPIALLAELEQMTGKPCHQMFDMIAGTSTGAIITAGLAIGLTAEQILNTVYKDRLPNAFPRKDLGFWVRYVLGGMRHLYSLEPFIEALVPLVAGRTVGDFQRPIMLMTTKDLRSGDTYYIVNRGPGRAMFADWPLSGAVAASGAAPIFFSPIAGNLIDGGVGVHGNPSLAAAIEAMEYIKDEAGFEDNNVILISLGTGYVPNLVGDGGGARLWLANWIKYLIVESLDETALQQMFVTDALYRNRLDFRRYNPLLTRASIEQYLGVDVDPSVDPITLGLDSAEPACITLMEQVGRAYARKIDWSKAHAKPWDTPGGHPKPNASQYPIDWSKTDYR